MKAPFYDIQLRPSHGSRSTVISWDIDVAYQDNPVYVAFSATGVKGSWEVLNPNSPVIGAQSYVDDDFVMRNGVDIGYYKLMVIIDGEKLFSPSKGILDYVNLKEYNLARKIIKTEYRDMRNRNGIPMFHCIPRDHGELSETIDPLTGDKVGIDCPKADPKESSFGEKYKGGFFEPCLTWVRALQVDLGSVKDRADNNGVEDTNIIKARMLGFPRPKRGHMMVDPQTDNRYYIGSQITPYMLRGQIAIAYEAILTLIPRSDPRYKFPIPELTREALRKIPR